MSRWKDEYFDQLAARRARIHGGGSASGPRLRIPFGGGGKDLVFFKFKSFFLDRPAVLKWIDATTARVFAQFGAYVMRTARNSIKSTATISTPGGPPSSHVGAQNRVLRRMYKKAGQPPPKLSRGIKEIYFNLDPATRSVVIGPIAFNAGELAETHSRVASELTTLELLEYGGTVTRNLRVTNIPGVGTVFSHSKWAPEVTCHYRPRPFMHPAFNASTPKLPAMWARSVK